MNRRIPKFAISAAVFFIVPRAAVRITRKGPTLIENQARQSENATFADECHDGISEVETSRPRRRAWQLKFAQGHPLERSFGRLGWF